MNTPSPGSKRKAADGEAAGGAGSKSSVQDRVRALVEPMPLPAVHELFRRIEDDQYEQEGLTAVKSAFIDHLNKFRPQRARRLFSELFVPVWTNDAILARARRSIPGLILQIDVGALWRQLSAAALATLAKRAQAEIDRLAATMLVNEALRAPEVTAIGEEMRDITVRALDQALASQTNTRFVLDSLNKLRLSEGRPATGKFDEPFPLDRGFLIFTRDFLAARPECVAALAGSPPRLAAARPGEAKDTALAEEAAEREALALLDANDRLIEHLGPDARKSPLSVFLPLVQLNIRRRFTPVALYLREAGGVSPHGDPLSYALLGHFEACCRTVIGVLEGALRIDERAPGSSVRITRRERTTVEDAMDRLRELIPALFLSGVLESRHTGPQVLSPWNDTTTFIVKRLSLVAGQRTTVAVMARAQGVLDQADIVWLIQLIWSWYELGRRYELGDQGYFARWRTRLMEDVKAALDRAAKFEEGESVTERMEHLLRLNEIAGAVDQNVSPFLSVSSPNMVRMIADTLLSAQAMDGSRRALVRGFIDRVREELRRSKRWQDPDLANLVELAEAQGL